MSPHLILAGVIAAVSMAVGAGVAGRLKDAKYAQLVADIEAEARTRAETTVAALQAAHRRKLAEQQQQRLEAEAAARAAVAAANRLAESKQQVRIIYREKIANDPNCAIWAAQPIRCDLAAPVLE